MRLPSQALDKICDVLSAKYPRSRVMLANTCKYFKHEQWNAAVFFESIKTSKPIVIKDEENGKYIVSTNVFTNTSAKIHVECNFRYEPPPPTRLALMNSKTIHTWKLQTILMAFGEFKLHFHGSCWIENDEYCNLIESDIEEYVQPIISWLHKMMFFNKDVRQDFVTSTSDHINTFEWPGNNFQQELLDFLM